MSAGRRFELIRTLGAGAYGTVYLADMVSTGDFRKKVALKLLKAQQDADLEQEAAQRLRDEARVLGRLRHRAIVQVEGLVRGQDDPLARSEDGQPDPEQRVTPVDQKRIPGPHHGRGWQHVHVEAHEPREERDLWDDLPVGHVLVDLRQVYLDQRVQDPEWSNPRTWDSSQRVGTAAGVPSWSPGPRTGSRPGSR